MSVSAEVVIGVVVIVMASFAWNCRRSRKGFDPYASRGPESPCWRGRTG